MAKKAVKKKTTARKTAKRKVTRVKVRHRSGKEAPLTSTMVRGVVGKAGYTGKHLAGIVDGVLKEVRNVAVGGVVTAVKLEKAIVRSVKNTNDLLMNNTKKITTKLLKK